MTQMFVFFFLFTLSAQAGNYTLADLEVLTQEGNYEEFFNHALDVRPSERQDAWKGMVSKMADGFGRQILGKSEITRAQFRKTEEIFNWPSLKSDDVYKSLRQDIGLRFLKTCLKSSEPCLNDLKNFWESDQTNAELAFKLAEMIDLYKLDAISSWPYLDVALKSPLSEFYCKKEFVLESIWVKFELDYVRIGPKGNLLRKIDDTLHPDCLFSFNQMIQKRLQKPQKSSDRELAYQLLAAQGKTNEALTDFFYTVYLLENPSQGELFNYAWNRLLELSKSISRREEVLSRLKTLDPLPDEVFGSLDIKKKKAILTHFQQKFPEYLSFYTNQCLAYYGGKVNFSNGNPTMKCPNLMESEFAPAILGSEQVQRFQAVRQL